MTSLGRRLATVAADGVGAVTAGLAAAGSATGRAFGASPEQIAPHVAHSPHRTDGFFANRDPASMASIDRTTAVDAVRQRRRGEPPRPVPVVTPDFRGDAASLAVTWLGHAGVLVEIDGRRVLTDPVFSRRCSPSRLVGPARMHEVPATVAALPPVDVVLISHDHYDHLDMATVVDIASAQPSTRFVAPIGVGAHLESWGIASERIVEGDWGDRLVVGDLTFRCHPARHFSGRGLVRNLTQWASWGVQGPSRSAFFTGDTGFTDSYAEVGAESGPYEVTLVPIGAYDRSWPDVHVTPEEAVAVHRMLCADSVSDALMVPIHWATFNLALHPWAEPVARLRAAAEHDGVTVATPAPGARIDVSTRTGPGIDTADWWRSVAG